MAVLRDFEFANDLAIVDDFRYSDTDTGAGAVVSTRGPNHRWRLTGSIKPVNAAAESSGLTFFADFIRNHELEFPMPQPTGYELPESQLNLALSSQLDKGAAEASVAAAAVTEALKVGRFVSIGAKIYMLTSVSAGSGDIALWPPAQAAYASGTSVAVRPMIVAVKASGTLRAVNFNVQGITSMTAALVEKV